MFNQRATLSMSEMIDKIWKRFVKDKSRLVPKFELLKTSLTTQLLQKIRRKFFRGKLIMFLRSAVFYMQRKHKI